MDSSYANFTITVPEAPTAPAMFMMDSENGDVWNTFLSDEMTSSSDNSGDITPEEELVALGSSEESGSGTVTQTTPTWTVVAALKPAI